MITLTRFLRLAYIVEFIVFALPLYCLAALLTPFGLYLVIACAISGVGLYIALLLLAFMIPAYFALWQLAKLSLAYVSKGTNALQKYRSEFRRGLIFAIIPVCVMVAMGWTLASDGDGYPNASLIYWLGLPPLILAAHLWLALRYAGDEVIAVE